MEKKNDKPNRVKLYDGYRGKPIFERPKTSVYYNALADKQCRVPFRKREEILKDLGID